MEVGISADLEPANSMILRPTMSITEMEELFIHLLRQPELLEIAYQKLEPGVFRADFPEFELVWGLMYSAMMNSGSKIADSPNWQSDLESGIRKHLDSDKRLQSMYEHDLLGTGDPPPEEEEEWEEDEPEDEFEEDEPQDDDSEEEPEPDDESEEDEPQDDDSEDEPEPDDAKRITEQDGYEAILQSDGGLLGKAFAIPLDKLDRNRGLELLQKCLIERYWLKFVTDLSKKYSEGNVPLEPDKVAAELRLRAIEIGGLAVKKFGTVGDVWEDHEAQLDKYRGHSFVGLCTGLATLDDKTLGLRGVGTLGSPPNLGKTALALEIALGVCRHHEQNAAVVVFLALDMSKKDLVSRIKCNLANMEASVLFKGSPAGAKRPGGFNKADRQKRKLAKQRMVDEEIGRRMLILDRQDLGEEISAEKLAAILHEVKSRVGASRALLIVDYLQILPVPQSLGNRPEMEQDKYRIRVMQDVVEMTRSEANPNGDAVLFISEARKPPNAKEQWGVALSDFMGTARLTYAVDYALLFTRMSDKEICEWFGVEKAAVQSKRDKLDAQGIAPMMLCLEKARDGMVKGKWGFRYHFKTSRFQEIERRQRGLRASWTGGSR